MNRSSPPPKRPQSKGIIAAAAGLAALAIVLAIVIVPRLISGSDQPVIGGAFTLTDHHGRQVTDADFRGRLMLIFFGYTFCPDVCPTTLSTVSEALDQLTPDERKKVAPLFVSVDPDRDTPEQMALYMSNFSPELTGLTGTRQQVEEVAKAYRVYYHRNEEKDGVYSVDHSAILYLMDAKGRFVAPLASGASARDIAAGIRKALAGQGGAG